MEEKSGDLICRQTNKKSKKSPKRMPTNECVILP